MPTLTVRLHRHDLAAIACEMAKAVDRAFEKHLAHIQQDAANDNQIGQGVRVLSVEEVAQLLKRSTRQLYRFERDGKIARRRQISQRRIGYFEHEIAGIPAEAVTVLDRRIIRRDALARKLGVHAMTVRQLLRTKVLPPPNERGEWLEREIDLWLLSRPVA